LIYFQGLLLDTVNNQGDVWHRYDGSIVLRKRWYNDVAPMISKLHAADIVWGDFKPENMLIDKDDVWLIDFRGVGGGVGFTEGWIGSENMETKKGDLQGLATLKKFLGLN
jgi:tRNA A-37 threonylcarbamoyl transferase component Bud32